MNRINAALAGALLTVALPAMAHHGTAVSYEQGSWITVKGTVTEFRWRCSSLSGRRGFARRPFPPRLAGRETRR